MYIVVVNLDSSFLGTLEASGNRYVIKHILSSVVFSIWRLIKYIPARSCCNTQYLVPLRDYPFFEFQVGFYFLVRRGNLISFSLFSFRDASSKWAPILSGVPQGTVLGPILFLLFINDLPSSVSSRVKSFADYSVLYRHIESSADHDTFQQDLLQLEEWEAKWQMNFAPSKCYIMSITLKRQPSSFSYTLCNTPLEGVTF